MRFAPIGAFAAAVLISSCSAMADEYVREADAAGTDLEAGLSHAVFASGCFWCTESDFEKLDGVIAAVSGFTGGDEPNPEYLAVARSQTGHTEAVRIIFDPEVVSYEQLLDHYWVNVDPHDGTGQFCDRGSGYAPFIFPANADQRAEAEASLAVVDARLDDPIAVEIEDLTIFWPAEMSHQDYAERNPIRYQRYRFGCRRDQRLREIWGNDALNGAP